MNKNLLLVVILVFVVLAATWPAGAQGEDPWGKLATAQVAATRDALSAGAAAGNAAGQAAQAEAAAAAARAAAEAARARAASQAAAATVQAAANADRQARAQATADAAMQATRGAQEAAARAQAMGATATAQAQAARATEQAMGATATAQAGAAAATQAAYDVRLGELRRRSDFGTWMLYAAGALALVAMGWFFWGWVGGAARRASREATKVATTAGDVVIEGEATEVATTKLLAEPRPGRGGRFTIINDPAALEKLREYVRKYGVGGDGDDE